MSFASKVKYSKLSNLEEDDGSSVLQIGAKDKNAESCFSYDTYFTYDDDPKNKYGVTKNNFSSVFKYNNMTPGRPTGHLAINVREDDKGEINASMLLKFTTVFLTFASYFVLAVTLPISYWCFVKKMGEFDRLVVFRLGKLIGVKGPGRVVIFPWMDRTKKIDVRAAAFSVPPQQFITCDGGIIEMGAEIQYGIVDVVTMVSEVADHQDILRSLSKTLLVKILVKKTVRQVEKERRRPAAEIQDELNLQVRKWGIDVQKVELSEPKVLKQPESSSNAAVGSILKGMGMKNEQKYPTPQEFVRIAHGLEEDPNQSPLADMSGNVSLLSMINNGLGSGSGGSNSGFPGIVPPREGPAISPDVSSWGTCLDIILKNEFSGPMDEEACGLYKIEITETQNGTDIYFISLSNEVKSIVPSNDGESPDGRQPDVSVTIASSDLASVLEGTLAPLQAYLTGRISASGDVRKLMLFDKLSKRGHKPGSMFSV